MSHHESSRHLADTSGNSSWETLRDSPIIRSRGLLARSVLDPEDYFRSPPSERRQLVSPRFKELERIRQQASQKGKRPRQLFKLGSNSFVPFL